jgi:gliding motility-associated-like protein
MDPPPTTTSNKTITHTFTTTGIYTVQLAIKTKSGCTANTQIEIRVGEKTDPSFTLPVDSFCNGDFFYAENTTHLDTPNINSITWHMFKPENPFKQDSLVTEEEFYNPWPPYNRDQDNWHKQLNHDSGWYTVALVTENNGCFDTIVKERAVYVHHPKAGIEVTEAVCNTNEIAVYNQSLGADSIRWQVISEKHPTYGSSHDTLVIKRNLQGDSKIRLTAYNFESGCVHTVEDEITFLELFEADFTQGGNLCSPAYLSFEASKPDSLKMRYFFEWKIGEAYKQGQTVNQTFMNAGNYGVRLVMTQDSSECKDTMESTVNVTGPAIDGDLSFEEGCAPRPIELKCNTSVYNFENVYWEIEDRIIPVTSNATLFDTLYKPGSDSAGFYTIRLVGVDSNGCEGFEEFRVQVPGPLTGTIKVRRFTGCEGNSFLLNAEIPGYNQEDFTYSWDLGNGETSDSRIANVTYSAVKTYDVKLRITDKLTGCVNTYTEEIDIEKERLYADFETDSVLTDCPPVFVEFRNKSISKGRKITSYFWDFGDSTYSIEESPSKLYLAAGRYSVKLWIEDEWGCKDSVTYKDIVVVKGPEGSYNFDKKEGCVPLEVNFTSTTQRTNYFEWDMGDGNVIENVAEHTHTYTQPGRYIPLLILSDTFGCSYTLPPIDTIYVAPYPRPGFTYSGTCINYPISFQAKDSNDLDIETYHWTMISDWGSERISGESVSYTFTNTQNAIVELALTTVDGCARTFRDTLDLIRLQPSFTPSNSNTCIGSEIRLLDNTISDTSVVFKQWVIAGDTSYLPEPTLRLTNPGPVEIQMIIENAVGCRDTLVDYSLVAGDTLAPPDLEILRVTVEDDYTVQLDYKESTLTDFKAYLVYQKHQDRFQLIDKIRERDSTRYFHTGNNTLKNSYCYKVEIENTCGILSDTATDYEHCTVNVEANGGLNHNLVSWNSYKGWDSVRQYRILRSTDEPNETLQFIATTEASDTQYIDSLLYCNTRYVYRIEAIESGGNLQTSFSDTAKAMPVWDYTPPPPKLVRATVEDDKEILIEWDSSRNSVIPIATYKLQKSLDGSTYSSLHSSLDKFSYVDQEVSVDDYSYYYRIYAIDECDDTSDFLNFGKTILLDVDTTKDQRPQLAWSTYLGWTEDVSYYGLEIENEDGSFTELATTNNIDSGFIDAITDLNQRPNYCYRIVGYKELVDGESQVVSVSNVDCSPVRSAIFYPNAFTPNGDNLNDTYVTPGMYIKEYHIQIFTRWGELIYESENLARSWDGTYQGEPCQQDAYAVIVKTTGVDGIRRVHFGTITLVR